jgi:hypothetical protein
MATHDQKALQLVVEFIREGKLDGVERQVQQAMNARRNVLARAKRSEFRVGDRVLFLETSRKLAGFTGVVDGIGPKNIMVTIEATRLTELRGEAGRGYRVHPSLLEVVEEEVEA